MESTIATRSTRRASTAFEQYASGCRALVAGVVFFLESAEHLAPLLEITTRGDFVIVPSSASGRAMAAATARGVSAIRYDGRWVAAGDELVLDGHHRYELQDYLSVPFISIVGPTVVRQRSARGIASFFRDADAARYSGAFVDQLLSSAVTIESASSFLHPSADEGAVVRVHVSAEGELRDGPDGALFGRLGDARDDIVATAASRSGRGRAFERIVDGPDVDAAAEARPWLGRYLAAIELLRRWDGPVGTTAISGFGGHLVRALDDGEEAPSIVAASAPFLVAGHGDEYILVDPSSRHRFRVERDAARAAECLIATGDERAAAALLAADDGRSARGAARVVRGIRGRLLEAGVDLTAFRPGTGERPAST
ncbi:daptide biosynthesis RiPP recognition protein [Microbacterium sp. 179-I 3D2 NHS]|uniref:daptide biosynthesis RiPP recognition protein n=1 Tax=Microbacterium sp. 179-I 3D2 NHS TaxID=3235178 RepID=UPI0039A3C096